ncbi:MAG: HEPN domain-containing protein [Halochromatium sp.]|uniref:HEPN domain-containing protein n=1 Tax=Halochromatium sp. TaxID=2049430 RepID=UPI00397B4AB7
MTGDAELLRKAQRYLDSARLLREAGDRDSAVSRTYYAAFYLAEILLDALGLSFSSHRAVISAFGQQFAKTGRLDARFHRLLISAFEKRQRADYLADAGLDDTEVAQLIADVESFASAARAWLQGPDSTRTSDR